MTLLVHVWMVVCVHTVHTHTYPIRNQQHFWNEAHQYLDKRAMSPSNNGRPLHTVTKTGKYGEGA